MKKSPHISKKSLIVGAIVLGAVALAAAGIESASAAAPPTTVTATRATEADATSAAYAICQQQGYNADRVDGVAKNADGSVTVTMYCYNV